MVYRLYIFVPPNSNQFGPYASVCGSLPNGCYNTGRFDDQSLVMRCSDARQFDSLQSMLTYAAAANEIPMEAKTIEEVNALCSAPQPTSQPPVITSTPPAGGLPPSPPVGIPVPTTEPGPGSPPVINVSETPTEIEFKKGSEDVAIYRLILESAPNRFDTGATYEGCSRSTPNACKPMQFASLEDAIQFSRDHGEIPVKVNSEAEAWDIVEGRKPVTEANVLSGGMSPLVLAGAAVAAAFILPKLLKGGKKSS